MKKRAFIGVIIVTVLFYSAGVVAGASFYPFRWNVEVRGVMSFFWLLVAVMVFVITEVEKGGDK